LTVIVDNNGQQAMGHTQDVLSQANAIERWKAFGWEAVEVNGHDPQALKAALQLKSERLPNVIIAQTEAGHGVSFMERQVKWHYMPMTDVEYQQAMVEVNQKS